MLLSEIKQLFERHGELMIYSYLCNSVGIIYRPPSTLKLIILKSTPTDLPSKMKRCLDEWTGDDWDVSFIGSNHD